MAVHGWEWGRPTGHDGAVTGAIILAVILVVVFPVVVALSGAIGAGILGHFLKETGEVVNEGSELIELNR
ncbi:hypothetical protein BH24ACT4_BH24ACT4_12860 [soil metagenome]